MASNQTTRVLELLKRFNSGEKICIDNLKEDEQWHGKSEKTIRRDLDVIKEYFPDSFELIRGGKNEKGCYKAVTKSIVDNFINKEVLSLLVQAYNLANRSDMFDNIGLSDSDRRILESKIKSNSKLYEFKNKPFESKKDDAVIIKALEYAIKHQKYTTIQYPINNKLPKLEVKPYKIVFINENFYVACEIETENLQFAMYRVSKIKSIEDSSKTFHKNLEIEQFIKDMQTPFAFYKTNYKQSLINVILEIDNKKANFFKMKKHLKSQKLLKEKNNGNLLIEYKVTQELEIEELIKRWLPFVKVVEPLSLKNKIENELKEYLKTNN